MKALKSPLFLIYCIALASWVFPLLARAESKSYVDFGVEVSDFNYKENTGNNSRSEESSYLPLAVVTIGTPSFEVFGHNLVLQFEGKFTQSATTSYSGTVINSQTAIHDTDLADIQFYEFRAIYSATDRVAVILAADSRYWKRFVSYGAGYTEIYTHTAIPVGIQYHVISSAEGSDFQLDVEGTYNMMLHAHLKAILSQTLQGGEDSDFNIGVRNGYTISMPATIPFGDKGFHKIVLYWNQFGYGTSPAVYNNTPSIKDFLHEPSSQTTEVGLSYAFRWMF